MHPLVRVGAEWTWRLLVLFAGFITFCLVVAKLSTVVIPLGLALLASAMLVPVVDWMHRRGVPRAVAVIVVIIASLGVVAGIMTFIVEQFIEGLPQVGDQFTQSINGIEEWLSNGPLHISEDQIRQATDSLVKVVQDNQEAVTSGALTTAAVIGEILTGALLTLFVLIFFLYGGDQIWQFVTRLAPTAARRRIRTAGIQGFGSLVGYVRATVAVAAADAIGIGAGLAILGVPLALPLASLVFIGAFIPIIGAVLTGFVAVFIALVTKGLITAVITLGIVVAVMQLEGHVLQPLLLGRAVRLHPLAVVLSITVGILLAGIVGGLLAVPIVAVLNTAVRSLLAADPDEVYEELEVPDPLYSAEPSDPHTPPGSDEPERLPKGELKTPNERTDADG
ncbi:AI-2E family transporter [Rhodococcus sp. IEGM 1401]|uniref:AI-2E family transporter n=1 Tax=unclassified Rhodococcus (in: high G+C Gram-positive bacteria) TaxID=192944 RepID=UPI0022B342EB|nr:MULTISPECIES: AI-2E family transporter [unclassified Rhodococcus (in: high G+C Gram-positive bacteria)]MCZ4560782.1 AI-2E family transporter [Rhodococcus sp. IEGM 1401]MDI9920922.1 AI-2E family transporter [Rhodococcus sp. IEGM 1372]MDV8033477.1 AI-2E family transporter [Rhodococcus sp. IEGM 1414]